MDDKEYLIRTFHGSPNVWEKVNRGYKPLPSFVGTASGEPWIGGEFYTNPDIKIANWFMRDAIGNEGDIYAFDINPKEFYKINQPLNEQSDLVKNAILNDIKNNPDTFFNKEGLLTKLFDTQSPNWNKLADNLYTYGVKGFYDNTDLTPEKGSYIFRYADDVPFGSSTTKGTNLLGYIDPMFLTKDIDFKTLLNTEVPIPKTAANLMKNPIIKGAAKATGVAAVPLDVYFAHQDVGVPLAKIVDYEKQLRQPTEFASLSPQDQAYIKGLVPDMNTQTKFKTTPLDIIKQYGAEQKQAWDTVGDWVNIMKPSLKPLTMEEKGKLYGN